MRAQSAVPPPLGATGLPAGRQGLALRTMARGQRRVERVIGAAA